MRKMIALLLILVLVFSLASVVFADDGSTSSPSPTGTTATDPTKPSEPISPPTGTTVSSGNMILLLAPIILLGLFGVVVATRKLVKNH